MATLTNGELNVLSEKVMDRWEELLEKFGITYNTSKRMAYFACPIHGGDKDTAFNFYYEGRDFTGNWKCRTHGCEKYFVSTVIGFIRGILSHQNGWSDGQRDRDKVVPFQKAVEFALDFTGAGKLEYSSEDEEKRIFNKHINLFKDRTVTSSSLTRNQVRKHLSIPASYYINRGYSKKILDEYDVGVCHKPCKEMTGRIVVPVYDDKDCMVGCVGRSPFEKCPKCALFHNPTYICPTVNQWQYSKWRNSTNFEAENILYNYWKALPYIKESGIAIIVEGPGDVWKLVEFGIYNVVAILGTALTEGRKKLLDASGAMMLVVLTDNDKPGQLAAEEIKKQCKNQYRLYFPELIEKDIGDTNLANSQMGTILKEIMQKGI